ncbi:MAG: class I SAM-dependent methyltransferase [Methyloceanibacter sp.]|nr:class I SAM-dependent methyltransferase [Methyloceanibacter sp.]
MSIHLHHIERDGAVDDEEALEQFQRGWATYQKVIDHNALSHREVAAVLRENVSALSDPIEFLDIACGDAGQMAWALANGQIRRYRGIDLSQSALQLAVKNLERVPFDVDLYHSDFVAELTARRHASDVSWCGLSIHHLTTANKHTLLQALQETTSRFLMIYEPIMRDGESLESYLDRFERKNKAAWTFLDPAEWDEVFHHISTCDLPESPRGWMELGRDAGFSDVRELFVDQNGLYGLYRYDR